MKYKKTILFVALAALIIVVVVSILLAINPERESMAWAKNLSVNDITKIELVVMPSLESERYRLLEGTEYADIVSIVNSSRGNYLPSPAPLEGGSVIYYITTKDGVRHIFGNNGYLYIDGDSYNAGYKWLNSWGNQKGNSAMPEEILLELTDVNTNSSDSDANTLAEQQKLTHDQAIVATLRPIADKFSSGECFAEGHIILGYDDSDENKTKIYTLTIVSSYGFENNNFVEVAGSAFPAVITLNSDNSVSIEQPFAGIL